MNIGGKGVIVVMGRLGQESTPDEDQQGMPPENIAALKSFIESKRSTGEVQTPAPRTSATLGLKLDNLPDEQRKEVIEFIESIKDLKFLQPDGKPRAGWKVFYGDSWADALDAAKRAAERESLTLHSLSPKDASHAEINYWVSDTRGSLDSIASSVGRRDALNEAWRAAAKEAFAHVAKAADESLWMDPELSRLRYVAEAVDASKQAQLNAAAVDASIFASLIVLRDAEDVGGRFKRSMHRELAESQARWDVWSKGYALYCDLNGELYVYCKGEAPTK